MQGVAHVQTRSLGRDDPPAGGDGDMADAHLIERAKTDRQAFALLYQRYFDPVYWYCYRQLGDATAAEDATSQVFAKVLAALPRYRERNASFRAWLFRIAHNVIVDAVRARHPHQTIETAWDIADAAPTPEQAALTNEAQRTLRQYLTRLPADQRRVVELRLAGLTGAEIAETLGRSRGAIDTTYCRAIARLRGLFATAEHREETRDGDR